MLKRNSLFRYAICISALCLSPFLINCGKERNLPPKQTSSCTASGCHPATPLKQYPPQSGKHALHLAWGFICENCHSDYMNNPKHKNGVFDAKSDAPIIYFDRYNSSGKWYASTGECSNLDCHGGGSAHISWYGDAAVGCTVCHSEGSPVDPMTTNGRGLKGKHTAHVTNERIDCDSCHYDYKNKPAHMNNVYGKDEVGTIVYAGGVFNKTGVSFKFFDNTGLCDEISCHGNTGGIYWYSDSNGCTACHSPGSATDPMTTNGTGVYGKHTAHVSNQGIECIACHYDYKDSLDHMNGTYGKAETDNFVFFGGTWPDGGNAVSAFYDNSDDTCGSISCHGGAATLNWYGTTVPGCTAACHSPGSRIGSSPIDATTASHGKHLAVPGVTCNECHSGYTGSATHFNGTLNTQASAPGMISFDAARYPAGGYDGSLCSNIYCHGNFTGGNSAAYPAWGGTVSCETSRCHGNDSSGNPADSNNPDAKHGTHVNSVMNMTNPVTAAKYTKSESCSVCHNGHGYSTASHVDGQVNIAFNYQNPEGSMGTVLPGGDYDYGKGVFNPVRCGDAYCHGNFTGGKIYTVSWSESKSNPGWCGSCHDAGATSPTTVKHDQHLGQYPEQCEYCHNGYTINSTPLNHVNLKKDVFFGYPHPQNTSGNPSYDNALKTCSNVYCHGNFPQVTYNGTPNTNPGSANNPTWQDSSTAPCGTCHGDSNSNYSSVTHGRHTTATRTYRSQRYFGNSLSIESCDACHNYGDDMDRTFGLTSTQGSYNTINHADFSINDDGVNGDVNFKADNADLAAKIGNLVSAKTTWNSTTTTCSNSWCHGNFTNGIDVIGNNGTPIWLDSKTADCTKGSCHSASIHGKYGCGGNCHAHSQIYSEHVNGTIGF